MINFTKQLLVRYSPGGVPPARTPKERIARGLGNEQRESLGNHEQWLVETENRQAEARSGLWGR